MSKLTRIFYWLLFNAHNNTIKNRMDRYYIVHAVLGFRYFAKL